MDHERHGVDATKAGDPVCWLHELCSECGAMPTAGSPDRCWRCDTALDGTTDNPTTPDDVRTPAD
jgi:hypothetical protein